MRVESIVAGIAAALLWVSGAQALTSDDAALLRDGLFTRDRNVAVEERPKPEYAPPPVRAGAFVISPAITGRLDWDSNVFATAAGQASDGIVRVEPSISAASDWSRNQISAFARAGGSFYFDHSGEDTIDYAFGGSGRFDARRDLGLAAGGNLERDTEPRTSEASPALSVHPVQYDLAGVWIEGTKEFDRLRLTARGSIDEFAYNNASTPAGAEIYEKDRDHTAWLGDFKAEYAYLPNISFVASLASNRRDYRDELPGEIARTSSGYEASVGANFDLTHLAKGEISVGYLEQDYDNHASFETVSGLALHGAVAYFPTSLTTITLSGSREVKDSGIVDVEGFVASTVSLRLDHELLRNLVVTGAAAYADDRYQDYRRDDRINSTTLAASYLLNRAVSFDFAYIYLRQGSTGADAGPRYSITHLTLSITCRA